jgi:peptide/nickel transport system substrate-binding protein
LVRKAIAYSIDYLGIIDEALYGQGVPKVANVLPTIEWAYNHDLEPYSLNLDMAESLLEEAGWLDLDSDGLREKDGNLLALSIMTNAGNVTREEIAGIVAANLEAVGFDITLEILDWGTVVGNLLGQHYDMVVIGWASMGSDPDDAYAWSYRNDAPGGGFNFVSYYNAEVEQKLYEAISVPGCKVRKRGKLYEDIQTLIHEDVPYAFLYIPIANVAWNTRIRGVDPGPWSTHYNIEEWFIVEP